MKVETTEKISGNRKSVRIHSKNVFNGGLLILDSVHMPAGCGTWPAFWSNGTYNPYYRPFLAPMLSQDPTGLLEVKSISSRECTTTRTIKRRSIPTPVAALPAQIPRHFPSAELSLVARTALSVPPPTKVVASDPIPTRPSERASTVSVVVFTPVSFPPQCGA